MGESRDLLKSWEQIKGLVAKGRSFAVCIEGQDGEDSVFLAGRYQHDRNRAISASMRIAWDLTKAAEQESTVLVSVRK